MEKSSKSAQDNRANQLNPNNTAFHKSRGAAASEAQTGAGDSQVADGQGSTAAIDTSSTKST